MALRRVRSIFASFLALRFVITTRIICVFFVRGVVLVVLRILPRLCVLCASLPSICLLIVIVGIVRIVIGSSIVVRCIVSRLGLRPVVLLVDWRPMVKGATRLGIPAIGLMVLRVRLLRLLVVIVFILVILFIILSLLVAIFVITLFLVVIVLFIVAKIFGVGGLILTRVIVLLTSVSLHLLRRPRLLVLVIIWFLSFVCWSIFEFVCVVVIVIHVRMMDSLVLFA